MEALSIRQPWAWLIAHGYKNVENRTWPTHYRGEFLIHTGKLSSRGDIRWANDFLKPLNVEPEYEYGGIVGIAKITNCITEWGNNFWFQGPYGFVIEDARPLPFLPCKGRLKFFYINEAESRIQKLLKGAKQ